MRAGVFPWLVAVPFLVVVGCFEAGTIDVVPFGDGGGSSSSSTASAGSTGSTGGMGSSSSSASSGAGGMGSGSSSASSGAGGAGGNPVKCPEVAETATMVLIDDVTDYCIDSTEVSNAQYRAWLLKNPDTGNQPTECMGNVFLPMSGPPPMDDKPVVNVDWCDAYGYCAANGKRLCGKIGGGPNAWGDFNQPGLSQWLRACTKGGTQGFPYGNAYDAAACNVADAMPMGTIAVGTKATCEGGYPGIFDMSGNVWEWEDSCDEGVDGGPPRCRRRGGSYTSDANNVDCAVGGTFDRLSFASNLGFRCCADVP